MNYDAQALEVIASSSRDDLLRVLDHLLCVTSFNHFVRRAWRVHHTFELTPTWHQDAICEHLQAVTDGRVKRLIINVPPGQAKSLITSVYWPAWEWLRKPHMQYIAVAAAAEVALRDANRMRDIVNSEWYQEILALFGESWSWDPRQDAKGFFKNTRHGHRQSRSTGEAIIGLRGDRIIVDDPLDASHAEAGNAKLYSHTSWFDKALYTRRNDANAAIVVIMQRLHEIDLAGHLIDRGGWEILRIPFEFEPDNRCSTSIGWSDPRTEPGETLPGPLAHEDIGALKRTLGTSYAGQYNQRPAPSGGAIFKRDWVRYWAAEPHKLDARGAVIVPRPSSFHRVWSSWDTTWKKGKDTDYVVGQIWGEYNGDAHLLWQLRAKMDLPELLQAFRDHLQLGPQTVLVEYSANGPAVVQAFAETVPGITAIEHRGESKVSRAHAVTGEFFAGHVYLPHYEEQPWVNDVLLQELLSFPSAAHDDQVDALTQALNWWRQVRVNDVWSASVGG